MSEFKNSPTFTIEVLVPQHLNLSVKVLQQMPELDYRLHLEQVRMYLLGLIRKKYPPFGGKMTETDIIKNLKKLKNEIGVTEIPPRAYSRYSFITDDDNQNISLKYNPFHTQGINHWFFEMWMSDSSNGINPLLQFSDTKKFFTNINSIIRRNKFRINERKPNIKLSDCLDPLRITNGSKPAFNFSSALAKWIYLNFAERSIDDQKDYYILDSCAGWGGRLGGALAACNHYPLKDKVVHYYGTDVNQSTHEQFKKIESYWKEHISPNIQFELQKSLTPAESLLEDPLFASMKGKFDIALTSPPYFNVEKYSTDSDQSYIKYPYYDLGGDKAWRIGFLKRMIETTYQLLRCNGEFWLNISNVKSKENIIQYPYLTLEQDAKRFAIEAGFTHILTYNMITPNIYLIIEDQHKNAKDKKRIERINILEIDDKELKYEPIFVFKKL